MKLSKIINASGKMTILGGSKVHPSVASQMVEGASNLYLMEELVEVSGQYLADLFKVESSTIVASASAGIALSVAASICKEDLGKTLDIQNHRKEIIIPKGHIVDYGTSISVPISMGGGIIREAGFANACSLAHVESLINENTAALIFVKSHHAVQKGMPDLAEYIKLGHRYGLSVIVDAAAEGDLSYYHSLGADAVIYSGTKTFEGPTSGLVVGTHEFVSWLRFQYHGIGRVLKVGKESIMGLVQALENYSVFTAESIESQEDRMSTLHEGLKGLVKTRTVKDGAGRPIVRCEITFASPLVATNVVEALKQGNTKIYTRDYRKNEGIIELDIRDINQEEMKVIVERIKEELS